MRVVIVKNNVVENIAEGGPNDGAPEKGTTAHHYDGFASIGWLWNDGNPVDPNPAPPAPPPTYAQLRAREYPPLADLAEAIVKQPTDGGAALDAYRAACLAVTAKYPKPELT